MSLAETEIQKEEEQELKKLETSHFYGSLGKNSVVNMYCEMNYLQPKCYWYSNVMILSQITHLCIIQYFNDGSIYNQIEEENNKNYVIIGALILILSYIGLIAITILHHFNITSYKNAQIILFYLVLLFQYIFMIYYILIVLSTQQEQNSEQCLNYKKQWIQSDVVMLSLYYYSLRQSILNQYFKSWFIFILLIASIIINAVHQPLFYVSIFQLILLFVIITIPIVLLPKIAIKYLQSRMHAIDLLTKRLFFENSLVTRQKKKEKQKKPNVRLVETETRQATPNHFSPSSFKRFTPFSLFSISSSLESSNNNLNSHKSPQINSQEQQSPLETPLPSPHSSISQLRYSAKNIRHSCSINKQTNKAKPKGKINLDEDQIISSHTKIEQGKLNDSADMIKKSKRKNSDCNKGSVSNNTITNNNSSMVLDPFIQANKQQLNCNCQSLDEIYGHIQIDSQSNIIGFSGNLSSLLQYRNLAQITNEQKQIQYQNSRKKSQHSAQFYTQIMQDQQECYSDDFIYKTSKDNINTNSNENIINTNNNFQRDKLQFSRLLDSSFASIIEFSQSDKKAQILSLFYFNESNSNNNNNNTSINNNNNNNNNSNLNKSNNGFSPLQSEEIPLIMSPALANFRKMALQKYYTNNLWNDEQQFVKNVEDSNFIQASHVDNLRNSLLGSNPLSISKVASISHTNSFKSPNMNKRVTQTSMIRGHNNSIQSTKSYQSGNEDYHSCIIQMENANGMNSLKSLINTILELEKDNSQQQIIYRVLKSKYVGNISKCNSPDKLQAASIFKPNSLSLNPNNNNNSNNNISNNEKSQKRPGSRFLSLNSSSTNSPSSPSKQFNEYYNLDCIQIDIIVNPKIFQSDSKKYCLHPKEKIRVVFRQDYSINFIDTIYSLHQSQEEITKSKAEVLLVKKLFIDSFQSVSHEFGTALNCINNLAEAATYQIQQYSQENSLNKINCCPSIFQNGNNKNSMNPTKEFQEQLLKIIQPIRYNSTLIQYLVNDILDHHMILQNTFILDINQFSLLQLKMDLLDLFTLQVEYKDIKLEIRIDNQLPDIINSDRSRLLSILITVIRNAIKYTPNGKITLHISQFSHKHSQKGNQAPIQYIKFEITDSGIGLEEDEAMRLKQLLNFGYSNEQISKNSLGNGIGGLSLSNLIAIRLSGKYNAGISFYSNATVGNSQGSENKNKRGTTFFFQVQCYQQIENQFSNIKPTSEIITAVTEIATAATTLTGIAQNIDQEQMLSSYLLENSQQLPSTLSYKKSIVTNAAQVYTSPSVSKMIKLNKNRTLSSELGEDNNSLKEINMDIIQNQQPSGKQYFGQPPLPFKGSDIKKYDRLLNKISELKEEENLEDSPQEQEVMEHDIDYQNYSQRDDDSEDDGNRQTDENNSDEAINDEGEQGEKFMPKFQRQKTALQQHCKKQHQVLEKQLTVPLKLLKESHIFHQATASVNLLIGSNVQNGSVNLSQNIVSNQQTTPQQPTTSFPPQLQKSQYLGQITSTRLECYQDQNYQVENLMSNFEFYRGQGVRDSMNLDSSHKSVYMNNQAKKSIFNLPRSITNRLSPISINQQQLQSSVSYMRVKTTTSSTNPVKAQNETPDNFFIGGQFLQKMNSLPFNKEEIFTFKGKNDTTNKTEAKRHDLEKQKEKEEDKEIHQTNRKARLTFGINPLEDPQKSKGSAFFKDSSPPSPNSEQVVGIQKQRLSILKGKYSCNNQQEQKNSEKQQCLLQSFEIKKQINQSQSSLPSPVFRKENSHQKRSSSLERIMDESSYSANSLIAEEHNQNSQHQQQKIPSIKITMKQVKIKLSAECCIKILCVDDEPFNHFVMSAILSRRKLKFDTALDGNQAIQKYNQREKCKTCGLSTYTLIFMDLNMPIKNGYEATTEIKQLEQNSNLSDQSNKVTIVTCSAFIDLASKVKAIQSGSNYFLHKPINQQILFDYIDSHFTI